MATATQVQVLYIAYFGRPADPEGLAFWSNGVAATNEELDLLADALAQTPEYLDAIAGLTTEQVIDLFYENLFGRPAEKAGSEFWQAGIANGVLNPQDIGVDIGLAALDQAVPNTDTQAITAKAAAAGEFTKQLEESPTSAAAYRGAAGIKAGREFLDPVFDAATIPSPSEVSVSINAISGGAGGNAGGNANSGNQGGLVNGVYNLSVYEDVINNQNTRQFEIVGGVRGRQVAQIPFALTAGNQSIVAVASDNTATNTLNALDSLVDASTTDADTLTISASGSTVLQSSTIQNIETISFALNSYNGSLIGPNAGTGINATAVNSLLTTGSLDAGNAVLMNATGSGASTINTSGTSGVGATFNITADAVATAVTGGDANEIYNAVAAGTAIDTINLGAGTNQVNNIGFGADRITHNTAGGSVLINVTGSSFINLTASVENAIAATDAGAAGLSRNIDAQFSTAPVRLTAAAMTDPNNGARLIGGASGDTIIGGAGNDNIVSNQGDDTINLGAGSNSLTFFGGTSTAIGNGTGSAANVEANIGSDSVTGYVVATDSLFLSQSAFGVAAVGNVGALNVAKFKSVANATADANVDFSAGGFLYNAGTGQLYYVVQDMLPGATDTINELTLSGVGQNATLIATFAGNPVLAATEFTVVA